MIEKYLERIAENETIPHSMLFAGPKGSGKKETALAFAKRLLNFKNSHPDFHEYFPEGKSKMHSIESVRSFIQEVSMAPFQGKYKLFIIHDAERMLPTSSNALLKTFEEPSKNSIIILISSKPEILLPTILSRCTVVRFTQKEGVIEEKNENLLKILAHGRFATYQQLRDAAKVLAEELQENSQPLFITTLSWYRDIQLLKVGANPSLLINPDYQSELQTAPAKPLEAVEKALANAKLSFERFTSTPIVIEKLFLDLGLI